MCGHMYKWLSACVCVKSGNSESAHFDIMWINWSILSSYFFFYFFIICFVFTFLPNKLTTKSARWLYDKLLYLGKTQFRQLQNRDYSNRKTTTNCLKRYRNENRIFLKWVFFFIQIKIYILDFDDVLTTTCLNFKIWPKVNEMEWRKSIIWKNWKIVQNQ